MAVRIGANPYKCKSGVLLSGLSIAELLARSRRVNRRGSFSAYLPASGQGRCGRRTLAIAGHYWLVVIN